jgi:ribosomal protein S27AE
MSSHNKIGSIDAITGEYVIVGLGVKGNKYKCPKCGKGVILADGGINARHYKHKKDTNCSYFNAGESDLHYDGKYIMKHLLLHNTVEIHHTCNICNEIEGFEIPKNDTNKVVIEYAFKHNGDQKYADVALLNKNDNLIAIVEIVNTHKTGEGTRPNPWFEVSSNEISKIDITINECIINCLREYTCEVCIEKARIEQLKREEKARLDEIEQLKREEKARLDKIERDRIYELERPEREERLRIKKEEQRIERQRQIERTERQKQERERQRQTDLLAETFEEYDRRMKTEQPKHYYGYINPQICNCGNPNDLIWNCVIEEHIY